MARIPGMRQFQAWYHLDARATIITIHAFLFYYFSFITFTSASVRWYERDDEGG
jgi:hypothetical protein